MGDENKGGPNDGQDPKHARPGDPIVGEAPSADSQNKKPDPKHRK
ncbi:hypothetical protein [Kitasatospora brasiliensis]|nr:hypothetical protein [Kitasatospora sp. K002]